MSDVELKNCPHCGSQAVMVNLGENRLHISCSGCYARHGSTWGKEMGEDALATAWNRRTPAGRDALADALIAWAADEDNVMVDFPEQGGSSTACIFCDYWDTHPPECLHERAKAIRGDDA